jgi:copper oxidase (laccase) domain-containing protein
MVARLRDRFFPGVRGAVWGEQVHGKAVALADGRGASWGERPGVDAVAAGGEGVLLAAFGADCPIVFIADRRLRAIGLVHSGRRGTEQRVVSACLDGMAAAFGTSPADCVCAISPSIGPCCYPVDLWSLLEEELGGRGVAGVENPRICTSCTPGLFHSYRRERGRCGRMVGAMTVRGGGPERR